MKGLIRSGLAGLCVAAAWAMLAPVPAGPRELVLEIPAGTWERRTAGGKENTFPSVIRLTLGVKNILVMKNLDKVPQLFGPVLIMPGQSVRLPFNRVSEHELICAAHSSGKITVIVGPEPTAGWRRLAWRLQSLHTTKEQA